MLLFSIDIVKQGIYRLTLGPCYTRSASINFVDVAEEILNKCTVNDPEYTNPDDPDYCVAFNYEFIEDTRDDKKR